MKIEKEQDENNSRISEETKTRLCIDHYNFIRNVYKQTGNCTKPVLCKLEFLVTY